MVTRGSTGTDCRPKVARRQGHTPYRLSKAGEVLSFLELSHKIQHVQKTWYQMTPPRGKFFVSFVESDGVTCFVQLLQQPGAHQYETVTANTKCKLRMGDTVALFPPGQYRVVRGRAPRLAGTTSSSSPIKPHKQAAAEDEVSVDTQPQPTS